MAFIYLLFYAFLELRFPDVETNQGIQRLVPGVCELFCRNLTNASSQYDLLLSLRPLSRTDVIYIRIVQWPHKCRVVTLKSAVFGSSSDSSVPPLIKGLNVVSGLLQGSVLGSQLFLLYTENCSQ